MGLVERALHVVATALTLTVLLGFGLFAVDQAREASQRQRAVIAGGERARERDHTAVREVIDDVNDVLLKPFGNVTTDPDPWIARGVPTLLAVLAYGFGLGFAASLARGRFR
jgi:hypothetical protein